MAVTIFNKIRAKFPSKERSLAMSKKSVEGNGSNFSVKDESRAFNFIEENAPKRITVEQLRKYKGFENVSDEEASNIVETLYKLAVIAYHCYIEHEDKTSSHAA